MKIKNQFILSIIIFVSILLIVVLSLVYLNVQINQIHNKIAVASNIHNSANDLNQISDLYLISQDNSQINLWNAQFSSISNNITILSSILPEQQSIVNMIENNAKQLNASFSEYVTFLQNTPRNQSVRTSPQFQEIWSQLSNNTHSIIVNSEQLSEELNTQSDNLHLSYSILVIALLGIFGAYLSAMYFIVYHHTLRSISRLQSGITLVGQGNLDYTVKVEKNDEVGELSNSFNQMTLNLKNVTSKLRDAERLAAIGQVAGMVGHDIRNPLQAITGELYLAKTELDELPENSQKELLNGSLGFIEKQADYIDKIIKDLQDYSKPLKPELVEVNICKAIPDVISTIEIPTDIQSSIICTQPILLKIDLAFLKRIMINLVTNAVQAMPKGGKMIINVIKEENSVFITVQDTGIGIPKDKQEKLFTPLFTTKAKGQGFGLVAIKRMTEALGGEITFESQEGKGSKFIVKLPSKN